MKNSFSIRRTLALVLAMLLIGAAFVGLSRAAFRTRTIDSFDGVELSGGYFEDGNRFITTNGDAYLLFTAIGSRVLSVDIEVSDFRMQYDLPMLLQIYYGKVFSEIDSQKTHIHVGHNYAAVDATKLADRLRVDFTYVPDCMVEIVRLTINPHSLPCEIFILILSAAAMAAACLIGARLRRGYRAFFAAYVFLSTLIGILMVEKYPDTGRLGYLALVYIATFAVCAATLSAMNSPADRKREICYLVTLLAAVFVLYFTFASHMPYGDGPDEMMRYNVVDYIMRHGVIPRGDDPEIRSPLWGFSYAYNPIFPYIIAGYLSRFATLFTKEFRPLLMVARTVSIVSSMGTVFLMHRIAKRLMDRTMAYAVPVFMAFFPSFAFTSCYVSTEAFSFMATALVVYFWVRGMQDGWNGKELVGLSVGMALCLLSYNNTYGFVLLSVPFFFLTIAKSGKTKKEIAKATLIVVALTVAMAAWWFIRNGILYDGDFLARSVMARDQELYASEKLESLLIAPPARVGMSWKEMLFDLEWIKKTYRSLTAGYCQTQVWNRKTHNLLYLAVIFLAFIGCAAAFFRFFVRKAKEKGEKFQSAVLHLALFAGMLIPIAISLVYSYYSDFQPQGRYLLPGFVPFVYFIGIGLLMLAFLVKRILLRVTKRELAVEKLASFGLAAFSLLMTLLIAMDIIFPYYEGFL